ncbi:Abi family protein [Oceanivirga miroungae]|uniref:Abi-like protein n=1 Tax=Oceanivirga miroungae TaxID=1130046 RepID=A0A6I8M7M4_9FUSO|nr:Abi family protein [Oceanivirga miroungae]VWL85898.1 hypothetical protein OMES3154_01184 [Oceanivirga miroungae]
MKFDKPFLTFDDQLKRLSSKYNLIVEKKDIKYLSIFSYYNIINGYKDYFMKNEKYDGQTTLTDLVKIHLLDKSFLNIIFKYSTYVEDTFKHRFAYAVSRIDVNYVSQNLYLFDKTLFERRLDIDKRKLNFHNKTLNILLTVINTTKDNPTKYYRENHNHIPAWVLFKQVHFKNTIDWFMDHNKNIKLDVISNYRLLDNSIFLGNRKNKNKNNIESEKIKSFKNALTIIRIFRNKIAHNLKVYNVEIDLNQYKGISYKNKIVDTFLNRCSSISGLYDCIIQILVLLDDEILIKSFINDILILFEYENEKVLEKYLDMYNLPKDFINKLKCIELNFIYHQK